MAAPAESRNKRAETPVTHSAMPIAKQEKKAPNDKLLEGKEAQRDAQARPSGMPTKVPQTSAVPRDKVLDGKESKVDAQASPSQTPAKPAKVQRPEDKLLANDAKAESGLAGASPAVRGAIPTLGGTKPDGLAPAYYDSPPAAAAHKGRVEGTGAQDAGTSLGDKGAPRIARLSAGEMKEAGMKGAGAGGAGAESAKKNTIPTGSARRDRTPFRAPTQL